MNRIALLPSARTGPCGCERIEDCGSRFEYVAFGGGVVATFRSYLTPHPVDTLLKGVEIAKKRSYIPPSRDFRRTGNFSRAGVRSGTVAVRYVFRNVAGISRTDTLGQPASPFRTDTREDTGPAQR